MTDEITAAPATVSLQDAEVAPDPAVIPDPAVTPDPAVVRKAAGAGRSRRATGLLGQVVGIAGIVVCLALVVGVLLGRGFVTGAVNDLAATLDTAVASTEPQLHAAAVQVEAVAQKAGDVASAAEAVSVDPNATSEALQAVLARLGGVSQRYLELRGTYSGAREQIVSSLDRLAVIDRLVPGVAVPQGPIDALATLDQKARALDTSVVGLIDAGTAVAQVNATAASIAEKARGVETGVGEIATAIDGVQGRLEGVRGEIARVADTVNTVVTIVVMVLIVVLLYLALLHLVLFRFSRGHARATVA